MTTYLARHIRGDRLVCAPALRSRHVRTFPIVVLAVAAFLSQGCSSKVNAADASDGSDVSDEIGIIDDLSTDGLDRFTGDVVDIATSEADAESDGAIDSFGDDTIDHADGTVADTNSDAIDLDSPDACGPGLTLCNGSCVDLQVDPNNCGSCGAVCLPCELGPGCRGGTCNCPFAGELSCEPCAVDGGVACMITTTPSNCGRCGAACPAATPCCATYQCVPPDGGGICP